MARPNVSDDMADRVEREADRYLSIDAANLNFEEQLSLVLDAFSQLRDQRQAETQQAQNNPWQA